MRLDELLVARGLAPTRSSAHGLIMTGRVEVNGVVVDKAGALAEVTAEVQVRPGPRFVSRAGEKLAEALREFRIEVAGALALDVGASTGGFVDCLLQAGARRVIALDVGRGQLDSRLRQDPRVHVLERVNARYITPDQLPYQPDLLTVDVSFISLTKVLPAVVACMSPVFQGAILVKPQFEAGPRAVGKGGIVRDKAVHRQVLLELGWFIVGRSDLRLRGLCRSALRGTGGNIEFFLHVGRGGENGVGLDTLERMVDAVLADTPDGTDGMAV